MNRLDKVSKLMSYLGENVLGKSFKIVSMFACYTRNQIELYLREVAGAEAPPLKKFSSKVQGKIFPFSYLTISNFIIRSAG